MNIKSVKLIYFSPTGTTKKVMEAIAQGLQFHEVEHRDLTSREATKIARIMNGELAVIGAPVYAGRLPKDMIPRLRTIRGNGAPAVVVVVYGNRAYEDALLELRDVASEAGFKPVAAGAFIGEHSYSTKQTPVAVGRPDQDDLRKAGEFGKMIAEKMRNLQELAASVPLQVPGNYPYKQGSALSGISPVTQEAICTKCGECEAVCPTGAISMKDTIQTDRSACIRCCACVKSCPTGARVMEEPRIKQVAEQLSMNCRSRKEPEMYI